MVNEDLRRELLAMQDEDVRVRSELAGQLGGPYVPRMEEVHVRNAARLRALIAEYGWPSEDVAGKDGARAAWFIAQHAMGDPDFQRHALALIRACVAHRRLPAWHGAYLQDRIAMQEGKPQRYGTQWMDDPFDGYVRPWRIDDPGRVDELRASVGLGPLPPIPPPGPPLSAEERAAIEESQRWWHEWLVQKGWRADAPIAEDRNSEMSTSL